MLSKYEKLDANYILRYITKYLKLLKTWKKKDKLYINAKYIN